MSEFAIYHIFQKVTPIHPMDKGKYQHYLTTKDFTLAESLCRKGSAEFVYSKEMVRHGIQA